MLTIEQISCGFGRQEILHDISLSIPEGKITAIVGQSGCGKTTFLKTLNRMIEEEGGFYKGKIILDGEDIKGLSTEVLRTRIGMVFQQPIAFPYSIEKNLSYVLKYHGIREAGEIERITRECLQKARLYDEIKDQLKKAAKKLSGELPDDIKVEYLHGKMKASQKNEIMEKFSKNEINVLVSTTVIEVGVNVPNATVMMVENAERFGLAQLHQLRGRVGRGGFQSYCIFVSGNKSKKKKDRLEILNKTNDGFKIAEEDLRLRGPGDFFGVRQSGDFDFGIADIYTDAKVLKSASEAAGEVLDKDPELELEENRYLAEKVSEYTVKCLEKLNI